MSYYVVWMDSDHAQFFKFTPGQVQKEQVKMSSQEAKSAHDRDVHKEPIHYYQEVAGKMKSAKEILLVGPGLAKTHFTHYLDKHSTDVRKRIVGVENMDHLTDNQITAFAHRFFRAHDLFENFKS